MSHLKPTFSVVIPLYNKAAHILDTLNDVVNQSVLADEVVIVDDGSTDDGPTMILREIQNNPLFKKVRLVQQKNGGVSRARNQGIQEAVSSHIIFLDADDNWSPKFIEEIRYLVANFKEARAFGTSYSIMIEQGIRASPKVRFSKPVTQPQLMDSFFAVASRGDLPFMSSSICIEKSLLEELKGFPEGEPMGEDQDVWARVAFATKIAYSPKQLSCYRTDAANRVYNLMCPKEECPFSKRLHQRVVDGEVEESIVRDVLAYTATHLLDLARQNIAVGNFKEANLLLADSRCNLLLLKKIRWVVTSKLLNISRLLKNYLRC